MTFSIIARDPERGIFGVAASTAAPLVGASLPHVKPGVGAIATQAHTNVRLGTDGLRLLELGLSPEATLTALLQEDADSARRQVAAIDSRGRVFVYSGGAAGGSLWARAVVAHRHQGRPAPGPSRRTAPYHRPAGRTLSGTARGGGA